MAKKKRHPRKGRRAGRDQREHPPEAPAGRLTPARRRAFTAVMLLFPVLLLALVEAGLRLGGYGRAYPLFIANEYHPDYLLANPEVVKRFFTDPSRAAKVSIDIGFFKAGKTPGSLRLFVQGGSTAAGFPLGPGASLAGMLQHRLRRDFPERDIEVISTAMSAVNSYTLLDFTDEILAQQPDAILVYAGHNEYLGVLGVGSVYGGGFARPLTQAFLLLKDWRIFQLLQGTIVGARTAFREPPPDNDDGTLMAQLAGSRHISYRSDLFAAGVAQFEGNLDRLLARYRALGIPVFVGTLVSNERDQAPFEGAAAPGADVAAWRARLKTASEALVRGDRAAADAALRAAIELDDGAADAYYLRGRLLEAGGDYRAARQAYRAARDRDRLRFRAPERFNAVIRAAARRHGATIVEVQQAFADASANGLVGNGLMLEHLHPNLDGYFLLADSFYRAMKAQRLIDPSRPVMSTAQARADIPVTEIERLRGHYTVLKLKSGWPFRAEAAEPDIPRPGDFVETLAQKLYRRQVPWVVALQQLFAHYQRQGDSSEALRVALILADALPYLENPQAVAGRLLVNRGQGRQALRYLQRAVDLAPDEPGHLLALGRAYLENAMNADAERILKRLLRLHPDHRQAQRLLARLEAHSPAPD